MVLGTILTPPVRKNHRKAALVACFTSWSGDRRACKMYPTPPLAQRQRQEGKTFTETSEREREGQKKKSEKSKEFS